MVYRLTAAAEGQLDALLIESARTFGIEAAGRYLHLIFVVMTSLGEEPRMLGSVELPHLAGIRAYPIRLGRRRVEPGRRVGRPRHLIVYRVGSDGAVEVLGLVHDRMVLSRAALKIVRTPSP